jgi:hypothetical protein
LAEPWSARSLARRRMTASCVVKEQRMDKAMLEELILHASEAM